MTKVALVTYSQLPQLSADDQILLETLQSRHIIANVVVWNDPSVSWETFDAIVIRSIWDYHERPTEFLAWLNTVEKHTNLWNPAKLVRWNMRKTYLRDLAASGIPIVPTRWLYQGDTVNLLNELHANGWEEAVIKPTIAASAYHNWRTSIETAMDDNSKLVAEVKARDMMIQKFLPDIETNGEWSFVFAGNKFSHAVLKTTNGEDFRSDRDFRSRSKVPIASDDLIQQATAIIDSVQEEWLYARVDAVNLDGTLTVMELGMIESSLYFSKHSRAAKNFADALISRL